MTARVIVIRLTIVISNTSEIVRMTIMCSRFVCPIYQFSLGSFDVCETKPSRFVEFYHGDLWHVLTFSLCVCIVDLSAE